MSSDNHEELDLLTEYDNILNNYDISGILIENDPDLKRMDEIMKRLEKGD